ncbi:Uncharacterized protein Rs2_38431 [Raphanus sativus]|nr:Uncharacterized protein Rs2_38431 [Raphanus sativus]
MDGLEHLPVCHAHGFAVRCPVSLPSSRSSSRRHHQLAVCCPLPTNTDLSSGSIFLFVAVDNRGSSVVLSASSSSPCCAPPPQLSSAFAVVVAELAVSPPRQSSNRRRPSFVSPSHRSSSSSVVLRSSVASLGSIYRRHVKPGRRRSRSRDPTRTNNGDFLEILHIGSSIFLYLSFWPQTFIKCKKDPRFNSHTFNCDL